MSGSAAAQRKMRAGIKRLDIPLCRCPVWQKVAAGEKYRGLYPSTYARVEEWLEKFYTPGWVTYLRHHQVGVKKRGTI